MRGWTRGRSGARALNCIFGVGSREKGAHSQQCEAFGEGRDFNTAFNHL